MLETYFASVGAYILVINAACVGVFLATDYLLLRLAGWLLVLPLLGFGRHVVGVGRAAGRRAAVGSAARRAELPRKTPAGKLMKTVPRSMCSAER